MSRLMVTVMVKPRKLRGAVSRHFPHPFCHFGENRLLQPNGLSERVSVFGRFWGHQILPNFTNFYQKCVAKGVRRGSKRHLTGGFFATDLFKPCQVPRFVSSCNRRCLVPKPPGTARQFPGSAC